ncbi:lysophospholipid acyltransferase family protein [Vitreoscilla stercoraria]|uniref:Lysophospholipid acyltransferase family protein n=1 Tax=Vitreoscilla stercoraria TaxID=61 RepID=A0ABY4E9Z8_VITST|nr:lysophospholipid acyltransferase family protein [Vitreoscilla stercoraria]UOO92588.1 lysophospholipid acyltransferase family protein [Vitreoscilla stercoraria]
MQLLLRLIFRFFAALPLPILHFLGTLLGSLTFYVSAKTRARTQENIRISQINEDYQSINCLVKSTLQETAKSGLELPIAWCRDSQDVVKLFRQVHGWEHVEAAIAQDKGLLFITPHIGSYDLAGRFISERLPFPLTAMYRPPKLSWLEPIMQSGRERDQGRTAPANAQGVKIILKALKNKEATIVLPDQVPTGGDGVWAKFFGQDAYSMTLAARLAQMSDVATLFFVGERLPNGQGFDLHVYPLEGKIGRDKLENVQIINDNVEKLIRIFPQQYLFSYNRFKTPAGAEPKPSSVLKD